jgi:hypothetical protein
VTREEAQRLIMDARRAAVRHYEADATGSSLDEWWDRELATAILAAVAEERERCAEIVLGMRNQRHAYRRIVGDPKARLPEYHHWALPFIDDVTLDELRRAQPLDQWHEAEGDVLWWKFPVSEPPYVGSPLDTGWPGYYTHWTRIALPDGPDRQPEPPEKADG